MISKSAIGIIELGNIDIKCLIFKINEDNTSEVISASKVASSGIHNGVIINTQKASTVIRSCISDAEKKAKVTLKKINVVVEQPDFLCTKLSKDKKIGGSKVYKDDIEFLLREAKKQIILNDEKQSIIHIFNYNYTVDGKTFIEEPINIYADYLSHEMTFVTMPKNNIKNIIQTFINCDIEIERFISCTFSLAVELLNNDQLYLGSTLVDIGFEKTSLGIFKNLALIDSVTLPVGTNHITKDISKVCSLNLSEAEVIKNKIDYSLNNNNHLFDNNNYLKKEFFKDSTLRKISKSLILKIIKSRLDEIFEIIKKQMDLAKFDAAYRSNFFVFENGSKLINLEAYFLDFFGFEVNKLFKNESSLDNDFTACLGALKIIKDGWETEAIPETVNKYNVKTSFFAKIFGNS